MPEQRPPPPTHTHTHRGSDIKQKGGTVCHWKDRLPSPALAPSLWLQGDSTGHGETEERCPCQGLPPRAAPAPPHGKVPPPATPLPSLLSSIPSATPPQGGSLDPQFSASPPSSAASIPGPFLQTHGQASYPAYLLPTSSVPSSPSPPSHKAHSTSLPC